VGNFNIAAVARRTGVSAATLRKWEERYGVLRPTRTTGGQRRYDESDVARVEWLRDRLEEGYRIGAAAALLGGGHAGVAHTESEMREALFDALADGDADGVGCLLEQLFATHALEPALAGVVAPLLEQVGDAWAKGAVSVADEHLFSEAVRARLERLLADVRAAVRGAAVLACVPGERHELGLLMLATLLRADGWNVVYLGADTPLEDAARLADRLSATLLCLSVTMPCELPSEPIAGAGVKVVLGGRAATGAAARGLGGRRVSGPLGRSVSALRRLAA
jgi:methanogenic corrinoid protein MtbC1